MYRAQSYSNLATESILSPADWYLHLYHAQYGKIGYINEVMSAYRKHDKGIWRKDSHNPHLFWQKHGLGHLELFYELLKLYGYDGNYRKIILEKIYWIFKELKATDNKVNTDLVKKATIMHPDLAFEYILKLLEQHTEYQAVIEDHNKYIEKQSNQIESLSKESDKYRLLYDKTLKQKIKRKLNKII